MAYDATKMVSDGGVRGSTTFRYVSTADSEATIATGGYFTGSGGTNQFPNTGPAFTVNDVILATGTDGTSWYIVTAVSATTGTATVSTFS